MKKRNKFLAGMICATVMFSSINVGVFADTKEIMYGDINGDGDITLEDAQLSLKAALHISECKASDIEPYDVDCDEKITLNDAQLILKKSLWIIDVFPAETMKMVVQDTRWMTEYQQVAEQELESIDCSTGEAISIMYLDEDNIPEMMLNPTGQLFTYRDGTVKEISYDKEKYYINPEAPYEYNENDSWLLFHQEETDYFMKLNNDELLLFGNVEYDEKNQPTYYHHNDGTWYYDIEKDEVSEMVFYSSIGGLLSYSVPDTMDSIYDYYLSPDAQINGLSTETIEITEYYNHVLQIKTDDFDVVSFGNQDAYESLGIVEYVPKTVTEDFVEVMVLYDDGTQRFVQIVRENDEKVIVKEGYQKITPIQTTVMKDNKEATIRQYQNGTVIVLLDDFSFEINNDNAKEMFGEITKIEIKSLTDDYCKLDISYGNGYVRTCELHDYGTYGEIQDSLALIYEYPW